jgi:hypothetical protein
MKTLITFLLNLTTAFAADAPVKSHSEAKTVGGKPNIVFILADDLGWKDIGPKARGSAVLVRCWIRHGFG